MVRSDSEITLLFLLQVFNKKALSMYPKKIFLGNKTTFPHHRDGWKYALDLLYALHSDEGTFLDGFIDETFGYNYESSLKHRTIPYKANWIGFLHNPPTIAEWYWKFFHMMPSVMLSKSAVARSLTKCKGIFVFSKHLANHVSSIYPDLKVEVLYHPAPVAKVKFSPSKFYSNSNPKVITIGTFLRRLTSIYFLESPVLERCILESPLVYENLHHEILFNKLNINFSGVKYIDHLTNSAYDELLSENIVFLDLIDSSANNIVIECITRKTPVLLNRLPALEEYLGRDYPLFYTDLCDASEKIRNLSLLIEAHQYLEDLNTAKFLTGQHFIDSIVNSDIYENLH
jgi:hypothetical protein